MMAKVMEFVVQLEKPGRTEMSRVLYLVVRTGRCWGGWRVAGEIRRGRDAKLVFGEEVEENKERVR
jgi:hypothetical protein